MKKWLLAFLFMALAATPSFAEKWMFAVIADNRTAFSAYRNVVEEIRDLKANPAPLFPPADFVLGCGDLSPVDKNDDIYKEIYKGKQPPFFPVRGNHETSQDIAYGIEHLLPLSGKDIKLHGQGCESYYVDWKNIRLIVLDQYCDFSRVFGGSMALKWLEETIASATAADHVFIALHEPLLPTDLASDAFWKTLFKHKDKVRALFAGHYHSYDRKQFPKQKGGIYYINVGNAGWITHSDNKQTIVEVMIDSGKATFRTVQAPNGSTDFKVKEEWESNSTKSDDHKNKSRMRKKLIGSPAWKSLEQLWECISLPASLRGPLRIS